VPTIAYNAKSIEALPDPTPPRAQQEHGVRGKPGLLIVAGRGGTRSWYFRYQMKRRRRKMRLGSFPEMGLKEASKALERARHLVAEGVDPMGEPPEEASATFGELCGVYLKAKESGRQRLAPSTLAERRRILASDELKGLRGMHPTEVRDVDVARALDAFEKRDALVMMNRCQLAISAVFTWAVERHRYGLQSNPVRKMTRRYSEAPRERTLSDDEIRTVWRDLEERPPLKRTALRLVLLTGARPGEVCRMRWEHITGSSWTMPAGYRKRTRADRGKPSKPHRIHLSAPALAELERVRGWERGGYVFPSMKADGARGPLERQDLARIVARIVERLGMDRWSPHDLRRTARTGWSDVLKVNPIVAEKMLGHALPPILRVYDQGEEWEERVDAFERWGAHILTRVEVER
jgi:integrase